MNTLFVNDQGLIQIVQVAGLGKCSIWIKDLCQPVQCIKFVLGSDSSWVNSCNPIDPIIFLLDFVSQRINRADLTAHQVINMRKLVFLCINLDHTGAWGLIFIDIFFECQNVAGLCDALMEQHMSFSAQIVVCILGDNAPFIRVFNQKIGAIITEDFLKILWQIL